MPRTALELLPTRRRVDGTRQPRHITELEGMYADLVICGLHTPYNLSFSEKRTFLHTHPCRCTAKAARLLPRGYLYRICSFEAVLKGTGWRSRLDREDLASTFATLQAAHRNAGGWFRLGDYATGPVGGTSDPPTWWTPTDPYAAPSIMRAAHRMGMPNNWVADRTVVLRSRIHDIMRVRVPTAHDAFFSEVFLATQDDADPAHGVAIDLTSATSLQTGVAEVVTGPVHADFVEFRPHYVNRGEAITNAVHLNDSLRESLLHYLASAAIGP